MAAVDGAGDADLLGRLTREYLGGVAVRTASFSLESVANHLAASEVVAKVFRHSIAALHPPSPRHTLSWAKALLKVFESNGHEAGELYEIVAESAAGAASEWHYRSFCPSDDPALLDDAAWWVSLRESTSMISGGTTGLSSWGAASALAEWASANSEQLAGRTIVELGCGPGLVGLAAARGCSPSSVVLTDGVEMVLDLARSNVEQNLARWRGVAPVRVEALDWTRPTTLAGGLILAADVVYDPSLIDPLADVLVSMLHRPINDVHADSPKAIIGCTERNASTWQAFQDALIARKLRVVKLELPPATLFPRDAAALIHILQLTVAS